MVWEVTRVEADDVPDGDAGEYDLVTGVDDAASLDLDESHEPDTVDATAWPWVGVGRDELMQFAAAHAPAALWYQLHATLVPNVA